MQSTEISTRRSLIHTRSVRFESYQRQEGLSDTEGRLVDVKPISIQLPSRQVPAGEAVRRYYSRWYRDAKTGTEPQSTESSERTA